MRPSTAPIVLITFFLALGGAAPTRAETRQETFDRGNAAYGRGEFADAADAYRSLIGLGVQDPRVDYNLGNAELKLGRLGPAILHYERALRLVPGDVDVRANLDFARSQILDRVPVPEVSGPVRLTRGLQDRFGSDGQAIVFLVLAWCMIGLLTWCASRPGGWTPAAGWVLAFLGLAASLTGASWYATFVRIEATPRAVVMQAAVDVLAGPADSNAAVFTVHEGTTVEVRSEREDWLQVSLPSGLNGWVRRDAVGRV